MVKASYQPFYKKIDRSSLEWGITIPGKLVDGFLAGRKLPLGTSREVDIKWDRKYYKVRLKHSSTRGNHYYQISYSSNIDLLKKLRKTFIQSYIILKSQKELFDTVEDQKQFRSKLTGGQQEVLIFQPIDYQTIEVSVFIKIESPWDALFQRLADNNVFGWIFDMDKKYLISRSTDWIKAKDFNKHKNAPCVVYYLVNTKRKLIYIGKAELLGNRVKPGKKHQKMPGDWDYFRYDIIKPEYSSLIERIEDHTIRAFASFLHNDQDYPSLNISSYQIVNSNWKKL